MLHHPALPKDSDWIDTFVDHNCPRFDIQSDGPVQATNFDSHAMMDWARIPRAAMAKATTRMVHGRVLKKLSGLSKRASSLLRRQRYAIYQ